jgi:hypothetical protein
MMNRIAFSGFWALLILFSLLSLIVHTSPIRAQGTQPNFQFAYINTGTTTTVSAQASYLHTVTLNGGTPGVVTLFDTTAVLCTGTPSTGKFAAIEATSATNPTTLTYDLKTTKGICVVTAAATDVTVSFN